MQVQVPRGPPGPNLVPRARRPHTTSAHSLRSLTALPLSHTALVKHPFAPGSSLSAANAAQHAPLRARRTAPATVAAEARGRGGLRRGGSHPPKSRLPGRTSVMAGGAELLARSSSHEGVSGAPGARFRGWGVARVAERAWLRAGHLGHQRPHAGYQRGRLRGAGGEKGREGRGGKSSRLARAASAQLALAVL